jgi:DCN1-like protein 4/5
MDVEKEAIPEPVKKKSRSYPPLSQFSNERLEDLFFEYADDSSPFEDGDVRVISPQGTMKLLSALRVEADSLEALMLAYYCDCLSPGFFSKDEFIKGLSTLRCDTLDKLKAKFKTFAAEAADRVEEVWKFVFEFVKEKTESKVAKLEDCVPAVTLLLQNSPHADALCAFLRSSNAKVVNLDVWTMLLNFTRKVGPPPIFKGYSEEDAWPVLIDEYVEYSKEAAEAPSPSTILSS